MGKNLKRFDLLQLIDRKKFDALVIKWDADKWVRDFKSWEFVCSLVTAVTAKLRSYREIEQALRIPRSTLGDALQKRCPGLFEDVCELVLTELRNQTRDRKIKRAIRQILAIDSTECRVHGSLFRVPSWKQKSSEGPYASAKLHVVWDINGEWIDDYRVTGSSRNDSPIGSQFKIKPKRTYVFDRAYCDLSFWLAIQDAGSHFVTRLKANTSTVRRYRRKIEHDKPTKDGVLYDGLHEPNITSMRMNGVANNRLLEVEFRCVVYRDPETKKIFYFVTSDFKASAREIAGIYRQRWAVELLFRWLKGHLDIRDFAIKTTNATRIQLAASVLTQLLLQLKKVTDKFKGTLWELLREIRTSWFRQSLYLTSVPDGCRWRCFATADCANRRR